MRRRLLVIVLAACGPTLVPVVPSGESFGGAGAAPSVPSFEVVARTSAGAKDPLPVPGSNVVYGNLEPALMNAVLRNVKPRPSCTLTVELVSNEAEYAHSRLSVSLVARATVRERNAFLAQTTVVCRDSAMVAPEVGAPVVWSCMTRLGRDLGGWFEGLAATTIAPSGP